MGKIADNLQDAIIGAMKKAKVENIPKQDTSLMAKAIADALKPILEDLQDSIDQMNKAIPEAMTAVGAGAAAAGAAGATSYKTTGTKISAKLSKTKDKIENL